MAWDGLAVTEATTAPIKELAGKYITGKFVEGVFVVGKDGATEATPANPFPVEIQNGSIAVTGSWLTDAQLRASPVPVDVTFPATQVVDQGTNPWVIAGTVSVSNFPATQAVTGDWLTDTQLRALPVPVDVIFPATQVVDQGTSPWIISGVVGQGTSPWVVSGNVAVTNFPATQPVSGTVTANQGTSPWVVSGNVTVANFPATQPVSGTVTANQGTSPWVVSVSGSVAVTGTFWPTTAAAPGSYQLSDGAAFYVAAKTGQLPSALVGGRLDVNTGAWLGSTAPTVGQKTMTNSVPIVIASDQSAVPVSGTITSNPTRPATATQTSVNAAVADTQLLASNANRLGAVIANNSSLSVLYVLLGSGAASATNYNYVLMPIVNGVPGVVEIPFGFTGQIRGFWNVASGTALISELTA